ncbi:tetratricopeptide repeat protein [Candidatus Parcubacteria bacterium]|nr:tetratricopeptide repeat protein [Candidatus Parcubacteria bacterium]
MLNKKHKKSAINFSFNKDGKLEPEPSDQEIDQLLDLAKDKKFESGIYNYCDRWCEKCLDTEKCYMYAQEQLRKKNLTPNPSPSQGEGNKDDDFMSEVMYSLKTTEKLIKTVMKHDGFNPDEIDKNIEENAWDKDARKRYDNVECLKLINDYSGEAHKFLEKYFTSQEQYKQQFNLELNQDDIKNEIEIINWYHTFLPTKVWRCLYEREDWQREQDEELKEMIKEGLERYFALVEKCFNKSRQALSGLAQKRQDYSETAADLLNKLNLAEISFRQEFDLPQGYNIMPPEFNNEQIAIMEKFSQNPEQGLEMALLYLTAHPDDKIINGVIGDMFINLGEFSKAIKYLETAARLNPNEHITHFLWGVALAKTGRFNQGLAKLQRAQALQPDDLEIKRNIGWVTAMRGRYKDDKQEIEQGRNILKEVVEQEPENVVAMTDLGQSYLMAHNFDAAFEWMDQAIKIEPDNDFVKMIHQDVIEMREQYKNDKGFQEFIAKQKAVKAYSGPPASPAHFDSARRELQRGEPAKDDDEMDEQVAKQFEIEGFINKLNSGNLSKEEMAKVMKKLEATGMVGQVTAITDPSSMDAKVATEYIEYHQKVPNVEEKKTETEIKKLIDKLFNSKLDLEEQKKIILILAHQGTEQSLAALEKFQQQSKGEMVTWLKMAIDECRAFLQSDKDGPGMFFSKV